MNILAVVIEAQPEFVTPDVTVFHELAADSVEQKS